MTETFGRVFWTKSTESLIDLKPQSQVDYILNIPVTERLLLQNRRFFNRLF